jgi:hypothetical protein
MIAASHTQMKTAAELFNSTGTNSPYKPQKINGIGDKAFYLPRFHQLWVLKGNAVFDLSILLSKSDPLAAMKKVAVKVAGKL